MAKFAQNIETKRFISKFKPLMQAGMWKSNVEFCGLIDYDPSSLSQVLSARRDLPREKIEEFARIANIDPRYFFEDSIEDPAQVDIKTGDSDSNIDKSKTTGNEQNISQLSNKSLSSVPLDFKKENAALSAGGVFWVPLVETSARAGYLSGWDDPSYIENLEKVPFMIKADKSYKGTYRAFTVSGDSMFDGSYESYKEGNIVLGREIPRDLWRDKLHIHKWQTFIVISKTEGILIKNILEHDTAKGEITLHSLNPVFRDFTINLEDVLQLYNVVQSARVNG